MWLTWGTTVLRPPLSNKGFSYQTATQRAFEMITEERRVQQGMITTNVLKGLFLGYLSAIFICSGSFCVEREKVFYFKEDESAMALLLPNDGCCEAPGNKTSLYPTKHFHSCERVIIHPRSHQHKAGRSRNVSKIMDEHIEEIDNQLGEDCDIGDEWICSASVMNSSEGE